MLKQIEKNTSEDCTPLPEKWNQVRYKGRPVKIR
jgi:hypothetical protein